MRVLTAAVKFTVIIQQFKIHLYVHRLIYTPSCFQKEFEATTTERVQPCTLQYGSHQPHWAPGLPSMATQVQINCNEKCV